MLAYHAPVGVVSLYHPSADPVVNLFEVYNQLVNQHESQVKNNSEVATQVVSFNYRSVYEVVQIYIGGTLLIMRWWYL